MQGPITKPPMRTTNEPTPADLAAWARRVDLAACYRLVALYGFDDLIFTHISARLPGPARRFLVNRYGLLFDEVTASSLVEVDADGRAAGADAGEVNPAGFAIHAAIHRAREDATCVLHVHHVDGIAVSARDEGLLPISQAAMAVLPSLAYHEYGGLVRDDGEAARLVASLGDRRFLMLRHHGLVTIGGSVAEAFIAMLRFATACTIQVRAQSGGAKLRMIGDAARAATASQLAPGEKGVGRRLAWPALLRRLDRIDPGFRS
jgi:ribulose-5-phosphate 4-epimerase/fuculose-1-phosphate aldolase